MKEQIIEKLKKDMSELRDMLLKMKITSLLFIGIIGWAICPLLAITGLLIKLYSRFKKQEQRP